jgi:hypothetical protein
MEKVSSLAEKFPEEQKRVREVLAQYHKIGDAGLIGASLIEIALQEAEQAMASGDVVRILQAYESLKKIN